MFSNTATNTISSAQLIEVLSKLPENTPIEYYVSANDRGETDVYSVIGIRGDDGQIEKVIFSFDADSLIEDLIDDDQFDDYNHFIRSVVYLAGEEFLYEDYIEAFTEVLGDDYA